MIAPPRLRAHLRRTRGLRVIALGVAATLGGVGGVVVPAGAAVSPAGVVADVGPWLARRPLNIAHAGGDLESPHETMYAYRRAVAAGANVLEMDLRLSADRQLMVVHDDTLDRTTNATGAVRDRTAAELQALDNAYWFVPNCWSCHDRPVGDYTVRGVRTGHRPAPPGYTAADFGIPTFRQVLDQFPNRLLDVEIKDGPDGMAAAEALADILTRSSRASRVVVVSFDDAILAHFRALAPDIATSPGLTATTNWFVGPRTGLPGAASLQVPPVYSGVTVVSQQFVADAHAAHLAVWVWFNGNDDDVASEWNRLLDLGVDGLITGKPRQFQTVLDARGQAFRTPLGLDPAVRVRGRGASLSASCPAVAADRCFALVAVRAGGVIICGAVVDLAPGDAQWIRLGPDRVPWRRLARLGLTYQVWGANGDTASSTGPLTLTGRRPSEGANYGGSITEQ